MFLGAGFYLITYDRGFVILLVNLLGRLACISLFVLCFSSLVVGLVLHRGCVYLPLNTSTPRGRYIGVDYMYTTNREIY